MTSFIANFIITTTTFDKEGKQTSSSSHTTTQAVSVTFEIYFDTLTHSLKSRDGVIY